MKEVCTIGSQVWSVNRPSTTHMRSGHAFSYAFYDPYTGEVWGKRTVVEGHTVWIYQARDPNSMDLSIGCEWNEGSVPLGLLCAIVVAEVNKRNQYSQQ